MALGTGSITLAQVCTEIGLTGSNRTLQNCYASANASGFNATYGSISSNTLAAFRGYNHAAVGGSNTLTLSTPSVQVSAAGTTTGTSIVSNTSWAVTEAEAWVTVLTSLTGTGNSTLTITIAANGTGSTRFANVNVSTTAGTPFIVRSFTVIQDP